MKTVVVISDTHGNVRAMEKLDNIFAESDYIIHLGDTSSDGHRISNKYPEKTFLLNGNCDLYHLGNKELTLEIEGVKIFACHGDAYGVKYGLDKLAYRAEELGCTVALYGHTHTANEQTVGKVTLFNPGTLSRYSTNTYLYLVLSDGKAVGKIVQLQ
jgi:hypothetical protein